MGQAASREAAKQARKAVGNSAKQSSHGAAPKPRPPPLGRPEADAPEVIEDATKVLKERQLRETQELLKPQQGTGGPPRPGPPQIPQPDQNSGFYRGQITDPRDVAQEQFLVHQSGSPKQQETPELAPDLLKFLQEVGPLEKKVNKDLTSPRIVKELNEGKESEETAMMQELDAEANLRTREDMRLVEDVEGFSTARTTNFFSTAVLEEEEADFGLTDLEMYDLLRRNTSEPEAKLTPSFHQEKLGQGENEWTDKEKQLQQQLLKDTMNFVALPVIIKDKDANYIGAHQKEVDVELERDFSKKLDVVDGSRVKLVLADLHDLGKKEIKKTR